MDAIANILEGVVVGGSIIIIINIFV